MSNDDGYMPTMSSVPIAVAAPESVPVSGTGRERADRQLARAYERLRQKAPLEDTLTAASKDILSAFEAERLTIYQVSQDKLFIVSRLKTGLRSFKDLKLPIGEHSIAGFVALSGRVVNVRNPRDPAELARYAPRLKFLSEVDKRTGFRTMEMLVVPVHAEDGEVIGVIQLINHKGGTPFSVEAEELAGDLAGVVAETFRIAASIDRPTRSRYDGLIRNDLISAGNFDLAERAARKRAIDVEQVLIEEFGITRAQIGEALASFFRVPYVAFDHERQKPAELLKNIRREYAESNHWVPLEETTAGVSILALDPERARIANVAKNVNGRPNATYCVTTLAEFRSTLDAYFGAQAVYGSLNDLLIELDGESVDEVLDSSAPGAAERDDDAGGINDNEVVKLVNKVILDAHALGASDIHIESYPGRGKTEVRLRRDGTLVPYSELPASMRSSIVARIKIMCDLDISEKRRPQDGKIAFKRFGPLDIELRVATIPVAGGVEDVVMRILAAGEPIPLSKLALSERNYETLKATVSKPYGIFFVCGPTGSGKTTTLHSVLGFLNTPETKIWTAEDPVEITQKGLRQVQVNRKAGMDFATVMRSFLRADPDIIMVGEMRDKETTSIGLEASLTGHLVLATLHTNSAPESITRLLDMGMDPFNFADALLGILAQRLAKRLCEKCKSPYTPDPDELGVLLGEYCHEMQNTTSFQADRAAAEEAIYNEWLGRFANEKGDFKLYRRTGCSVCSKTGYKGRVGLHELLIASDEVKRLVQERARVADVLAVALEEGMRTLKMDGIEKVLGGYTDMAQVRAVCIK